MIEYVFVNQNNINIKVCLIGNSKRSNFNYEYSKKQNAEVPYYTAPTFICIDYSPQFHQQTLSWGIIMLIFVA